MILLLLAFILPVWAADCLLVMPAFPLTYAGLLTPYRLQGATPADKCLQETTTTFVEATIFNPDTGSLVIYHPLVITDGTTPLVPPTTFLFPPNAIVSLSFGTNANTLRLTPPTSVLSGRCVNGASPTDLFGQFAYCNSDALLDHVNAHSALIPPIPPLGVANDGLECLTTRHFMLVDQDPSDNLVTTYLLDPITRRVAQDTAATRLAFPGAIVLKNGSDNRLLVTLNLAMGCRGYFAPLVSDPSGAVSASMILNELHAANRQGTPVVSLPSRDPMTRVVINGVTVPSVLKGNLYRRGVNQPQLVTIQQADTTPFCGHLVNNIARLQANKASFTTQASPDAAANSLFTFLATRFSQTYLNLKCDVLLDQPNPVVLTTVDGVTTDAVFSTVPRYQFLGQDPYEVIDPTPTAVPTAVPTTAPTTAPTTVPTAPISYALGTEIVSIVFGIIAIFFIVFCMYRWRTETRQEPLIVPILSMPESRSRSLPREKK